MPNTSPEHLKYTGKTLEDSISHINSHVNIEKFLSNGVGLEEHTSKELAAAVRNTGVSLARSDAMAMSLSNVPKHDASVTRLVDSVLPITDKIIIRSGIVEVFRKSLEDGNPGFLDLSGNQIRQGSVRLAAAYELGEFISRKVFGLIKRNFDTTSYQMPRSNKEAVGFFQGILKDLKSRDPSGNIGDYYPSQDAIDEYFRHTRELRFCARGGWFFLDMIDTRINMAPIQENMRRYHYDQLAEGSILPPQDIGALYPLKVHEFKLLCSFISKSVDSDKKVVPIDRNK